jgi:bifunctional non-homologous end joining protein LigD
MSGTPKNSGTAKVTPKAEMPADIAPMLATLVKKPAAGEGWLYEVKWDGYRCIAYADHGDVQLRSRNNKSFNEKFYPLYEAFKSFDSVILDGEIVVLDEKGMADFSALQSWRSEADGSLVFYAFDILFLNGQDLMQKPFVERREYLEQVIPKTGNIRLSRAFDVTGSEFFALAEKMSLEGILAKKTDSIYKPGARSKDWLKIKTEKHQEALIAGYTLNENTSRRFSALLLGIYENGELRFIGPVGTGFSDQMQEEILKKLKPLITPECPFKEVPEYNKPSRFRPNPPKASVTWVKPEIIAEISYREQTPDGSIRHPSFRGIREDKRPEEVVREEAADLPRLFTREEAGHQEKMLSRPPSERKTLLNPSDETQVRKLNGHPVKFSNLSKIFWPEEKVTKRDLLNYYYQIAPYILPFLKNRPQTMNRYPNGIYGKSFYQKDVTGKVPEWVETFRYFSETDNRMKNFPVTSDEAALLYLVSLGCIEINPWCSTCAAPDHPDWCIIDLDPDNNPFSQVIEAAQVTRDVLKEAGIESWCKTSGSTGIHIYFPLGAKYTYEESKEFARVVARIIHRELPDFTSIERYTTKRKGKLYIDFLQNRPQATVAAPYSLRPRPGATVSMPLHWEEVKPGLSMTDFTIFNAPDRARETGHMFRGVLGKGIDIARALKKLQPLLGVFQ